MQEVGEQLRWSGLNGNHVGWKREEVNQVQVSEGVSWDRAIKIITLRLALLTTRENGGTFWFQPNCIA